MSDHLLIAALGRQRRVERLASERARQLAGTGIGVVVEIGRERPRPASLLAPEEAKNLEATLGSTAPGVVARARGDPDLRLG